MAKKRAKISPTNLFDKTEYGQTKPALKDKRINRTKTRATYDLTVELKTAVSDRATKLGIPASQLAAFLLCDALQRFDAGDIDPTPYLTQSDSPRFRSTLEIDDWYYLGDVG